MYDTYDLAVDAAEDILLGTSVLVTNRPRLIDIEARDVTGRTLWVEVYFDDN